MKDVGSRGVGYFPRHKNVGHRQIFVCLQVHLVHLHYPLCSKNIEIINAKIINNLFSVANLL